MQPVVARRERGRIDLSVERTGHAIAVRPLTVFTARREVQMSGVRVELRDAHEGTDAQLVALDPPATFAAYHAHERIADEAKLRHVLCFRNRLAVELQHHVLAVPFRP